MVMHVCNPSIWEVEVKNQEFKVILCYWGVGGQLGLYETLS